MPRPLRARPPHRRAVGVDLLTSLFLHADLVHLKGNLLFLWIYGDNVEHRLGRLQLRGLPGERRGAA